ncbi:hypothetical protein [Burkholderia sp. MSMB617WGS]|uniref:hypothetical protein n=1 Tax=Burkholderia sp. MSMB617WGS TaxID=1637831 RepID=UPI001646DA20|nr:hypothetical protein [Burkholderia sp. MSMB617WGS]
MTQIWRKTNRPARAAGDSIGRNRFVGNTSSSRFPSFASARRVLSCRQRSEASSYNTTSSTHSVQSRLGEYGHVYVNSYCFV